MKTSIKILISFLFISFFACEDELAEPVIANAEHVIEVNSELYNLIERIAAASEDNSDIGCIDFVYPLTLFTYDADLLYLDSHFISNDTEFSTFLGTLNSDNSISLSLPITTILDGGLTLTINTYEELKETIDNCIDDDFLQYCNGTLPSEECIWKVVENGQYTGSYFSMNDDGSVTFNDNNNTYLGTWVVLIINDEVHLNINLEGNSNVAQDWNFDWIITLTDEGNFELNNGENMFILEKDCEEACNLSFEECETEVDSGIAQFELNTYTECILSTTEVTDPSTVTVTFHNTQADAEANANAISGVFTNIENPHTIFVRIEDNMSGEATYISISLEAATC